MSATLTVYLRNGLVFTFEPSEHGLPAPSEKVIAQMMAQEIAPVELAVPRIVLRWSDVVAVRIEETSAPRDPRPRRRQSGQS